MRLASARGQVRVAGRGESSVTRTRPAAAAGSFYPHDPAALADTVDALLAAVPDTGHARPKAVIVPHAGYVYSGPVAASAYALVRRDPRRRVMLLGPSHFTGLAGLAGSSATRWRTPLGEVAVEPPPEHVAVDDAAHAREHALEVQLPFLQRVLGTELRILPLAVGAGAPDTAADVLDALWRDPDVLVVCSTDLSHYHDHETARRLDRRTAQAIVARDVDAVGPYDACGCDGVRALLALARRHNDDVTLLDLRTSGDTAGERARVVGYGAFSVGVT